MDVDCAITIAPSARAGKCMQTLHPRAAPPPPPRPRKQR